jgi:hypothetical protein
MMIKPAPRKYRRSVVSVRCGLSSWHPQNPAFGWVDLIGLSLVAGIRFTVSCWSANLHSVPDPQSKAT